MSFPLPEKKKKASGVGAQMCRPTAYNALAKEKGEAGRSFVVGARLILVDRREGWAAGGVRWEEEQVEVRL